MTPLKLRLQLVQELPNIPDGISLTPVKGKQPFRKGWQTEPTIDRSELATLIKDGQMLWSDKHQREWRAYWDGYGIRTGQPSGGKLALDVDGITAVEILDRISGGDIPTTVSWTSGKVGRKQLLLQLSDSLNDRLVKIGFTHFPLKEFEGFKCEGDEQLDFRYDRCQSVLPPSKHPDTGAYRWIHSFTDVAVAAAPDWVEQFLNDYCDRYEQAIAEQEAKRQQRTQKTSKTVSIRYPEWSQADWALYYLDKIDPNHLDWYVWRDCLLAAAHSGVDEHQARSWSSQSDKHTDRGFDAVWFHIKDGHSRPLTAGTLHHHAKQQGWTPPKKSEFGEPDATAYAEFRAWEDEQIAVEAAIAQERKFDRLINLLAPKKRKAKRETTQRIDKPAAIDFEYEEGDRLDTWQRSIEQGCRYILDQSGTGTGKSFDAGRVEPRDFKARSVIYLSPQHRNPTVETLAIENGWIDLEARHAGLVSEETPGGGQRLKRAGKGETPNVHGNCGRTSMIAALRSKNIDGADTAALICGTCPLQDACQHSSGKNFGFLNQRRSALLSPKRRSHPDSEPDPTQYDFSETLALWDEAGENFTVKRDVIVTMQDLQQTIAALLTAGLFEPMQALLTALLPYLDGSAKTGRYGLNYADVVKLLGDVDRLDIEAIERALQPRLEEILNPEIAEGVTLADLPSSSYTLKPSGFSQLSISKRVNLRRAIGSRDSESAELAEQRIVKQWLPDLLRILKGQAGSLHLGRRTLTISMLDNRHRAIAHAAKANIFLDATLSRESLALKLGCQPEEIYVCRQRVNDAGNLTITQIADLGRMGMQRGADQQRRATAIISHYRQIDPTTKAIDFKRLADEGTGAWWRDSRGVNDFMQTKTLILSGTPCRNLADLQAEYSILTGDRNFEGDTFKAFVDRLILADIHQAIGRLRAHRRPDERLEVILLTDFALDIPTRQVSAVDICPDAADKTQRVVLAAQRAIEHLKSAGEKLTQSAVAAIVGCTQARISQLWEFINFAMESPNSRIYNSADSPPDPDLVQVVETVATEATIEGVLQSLPEMFFEFFQPHQWRQLWQQLSGKAQTRILEAVILTFPEAQIDKMRRAIA